MPFEITKIKYFLQAFVSHARFWLRVFQFPGMKKAVKVGWWGQQTVGFRILTWQESGPLLELGRGILMSNDGPHISWSETVGNICHGELLSWKLFMFCKLFFWELGTIKVGVKVFVWLIWTFWKVRTHVRNVESQNIEHFCYHFIINKVINTQKWQVGIDLQSRNQFWSKRV